MPSMVAPQRIAAARLHGQFLVGESPHRTAADVVRALGAVQSQDVPGARWGLAMRSRGLDEAAVDRELDRGDIVRTHVLRPTWHFVAPEDLRWMQALTGGRVARILATYNVRLGLTPTVVRRAQRVIQRALEEHGAMTRAQLKTELVRAKIDADGVQPLAHLVMQAELDALVCSGPKRGKQQTYALVDQRVKKSRALQGDEALHELTLRYFASRAPASVHDFSWWSGLTIAECKRGVELAGSRLQRLTLNGKTCHAPRDFELPAKIPATAHLLPNYDEYFIGFRDRSAIGQRMSGTGLVTGGNALISHVVAVGGQLVGGWRRGTEGGRTVARLNVAVELTRAEERRVNREAERFAAFANGK